MASDSLFLHCGLLIQHGVPRISPYFPHDQRLQWMENGLYDLTNDYCDQIDQFCDQFLRRASQNDHENGRK